MIYIIVNIAASHTLSHHDLSDVLPVALLRKDTVSFAKMSSPLDTLIEELRTEGCFGNDAARQRRLQPDPTILQVAQSDKIHLEVYEVIACTSSTLPCNCTINCLRDAAGDACQLSSWLLQTAADARKAVEQDDARYLTRV